MALNAAIVVLGLVLLAGVVNVAIEVSKPRYVGTPMYIARRSPAQRALALSLLVAKVQAQGALVGGFVLAVYWRWFRTGKR